MQRFEDIKATLDYLSWNASTTTVQTGTCVHSDEHIRSFSKPDTIRHLKCNVLK